MAGIASRRQWLPGLSADGWLLVATCAVRTFAYGLVSVVMGLYLASLGYDTATIGGIFTAAMVGGAVTTVLVTQVADRLGRRLVLVVGASLMALGGAAFAMTDNAVLLTVTAIVGTISPSGREIGPFASLEQAMLPQTASDDQRTHVFATYNPVGSLAGAVGALAVGLPALFGFEPQTAHRVAIWAFAAIGVVLLLLFARLSPAVEAGRAAIPDESTARPRFGIHRSRGVAFKLAGLGALDSFGQGFVVQGLLAYWFSLRFGADVFTAVSFLAAAPLARRIGLLNTMVFTHLPSNVLLMLVPLMPTLELAVVVLLARQLLSQLDVPTRQSYTMAIVDPDERAAVAGLSAVARNTATAIAPVFSGVTLATPALGVPFLIAGSLKIVYDLALFAVFRKVRPPEELARQEHAEEGNREVGHA